MRHLRHALAGARRLPLVVSIVVMSSLDRPWHIPTPHAHQHTHRTYPQLTVAESHGYDDAVSGGHIARAGRGNIVRAGLGVGRAAVGGGGAEVRKPIVIAPSRPPLLTHLSSLGRQGDKKAAAAGSAKGPPTSAAALREATKACLLAYQTILRALGEVGAFCSCFNRTRCCVSTLSPSHPISHPPQI